MERSADSRIRRPSQARVLACAALAAVALAGTGCGGADATGPNRALPNYVGRATELFDDSIEPAAVGLDLERAYTPRNDPTLRERTQVSDAVLRVRVATVTAKRDGPDVIYQLVLHTTEKLVGSNAPAFDFPVTINKASGSLGIMKNLESRLVGYPFIAFVHAFNRGDEGELHFHLSPDTKEVKQAVGDAMAQTEFENAGGVKK